MFSLASFTVLISLFCFSYVFFNSTFSNSFSYLFEISVYSTELNFYSYLFNYFLDSSLLFSNSEIIDFDSLNFNSN